MAPSRGHRRTGGTTTHSPEQATDPGLLGDPSPSASQNLYVACTCWTSVSISQVGRGCDCTGHAGPPFFCRPGEALLPDGTVYFGNLRGAQQTDVVILDGRPEGRVFEPRFTTHGFRYVQVEGVQEPPRDVLGIAYGSDLETRDQFECSHPLFNRLWQAIWWTLRSNFVGIPTDTCQHNERLPWVGMYPTPLEFSTPPLTWEPSPTRATPNCVVCSLPDGTFPMHAPSPLRMNTPMPGNGDVGGIWSPWEHYLATADREALRRQYNAARRWGDYRSENIRSDSRRNQRSATG